VFGLNPVAAEVIVEPFGLCVSLGENDTVFAEITLINNNDEEIGFEIDFDIVDPEDNLFGPRRDDLGDVIGEFECHIPGGRYKNGCWDDEHEWFWIQNYSPAPRRICAFDPADDYEIVADFNTGELPMDLAYYEGIIYIMWLWNPTLHRFDVEGDNLGGLDLQGHRGINGIAIDREREIILAATGAAAPHSLFAYDLEGNQLGELGNVDQLINNNLYRSIEWVPEHRDGPLWVSAQNNVYQIGVDMEGDVDDWELTEVLQNFNAGNPNEYGVIAHDGENIWISNHQNSTITGFDDGVTEFRNIVIDPDEGILAADDSAEITLTLLSTGIEEAVSLEILIEIEFESPNQPNIVISTVMTVEDPVIDITGEVTDAATGEVVENVTIDMDRYRIIRYSDENGSFNIDNLPFGDYEFTFFATNYLPMIREVNVVEEGDINLEVALLHSECNPDVEDIIFEIAPDTDLQTSFEISNDGNGPLTYNVERRLLGDANADPWTLRMSHMFGQDREDSRIQGVVFAEDRFYVAGAHGNEPAIYIFSREGEYIDLFIQPGEDRYGMKDLAWDGRLIWGAIGQTIYGMTLDGDVEVEFEGPFRPTSNLVWDPEHELLWVSATTSNIVSIDRNGNLVSELDRQGLRMYGFGYWSDDPDDSPLYIFNRVRDVGDQVVHKMNLDNGELTLVSILEPEGGGSAAGAFITNEYDIYSWVFITVANAGADDRVDIWQIDARKEWFLLEPMEGVIEADSTQEFDLTLDATGLPPEVFEGELVFLHDGVGSETHIPVTLRVVEGPVQAERTLQLELGWNMVSVNLQPDPDDIRVLMRELVEADLLLLMKDGQGRFYSPEFDFCNIPGWNVADGYQMKMDDAGEVTLAGITVMADDAIPLTDGWNLISYYPRTPVDAIIAFSGIVDQLLMAKDGWGRFYNPEWDFSNMGDLQELRGYQVKVTEDMELVYRLQAEDDEFVMNVFDRQGKLPLQPLTGNNMSLLVKGGRIQDGEIGVYANGELVGSGVLEDGNCGIAIWGDDPTTPEIDGAIEGGSLELSVFDENGSHPVQFETLAGDGLYRIDGFWAVELTEVSMLPDDFGIVSAYPNPFNSQTRVTYNLLEASHISLALYDLSGRRILDIESGYKKAGQYTIAISGASLASGVYLVQLKAKGEVSRSKLTLVK